MSKMTHVVTGPKTILSYLNVNEPKAAPGGKPKYSASLIISKDDTDTLDKIHKAIEAAYEEGEGKLKGNGRTVPPLAAIKTPLRDGDLERPDDPAYQNAFFLNANNPRKPGVVDAHCNPITDTSELYSGIIGRVSINFYAFSVNGNRGIACSLNNIQKLEDGTPLGSHISAAEDFAAFKAADGADDFLN